MPYREQPTHCELCHAELSPDHTEGFCELTLCPRCGAGDIGPSLNARGIGVQTIDYRAGSFSPETRAFQHYTLVTGAVPYDVGVQAEFLPEDLYGKLTKLFFSEIQVGDEQFDDDVLIRTRTDERTRELLRQPVLRAAIHQAVSDLQLFEPPVRLDGNAVRLSTEERASATPVAELRRLVATLMHGLDAWAADAGLPRQPERVRLPDLGHLARVLAPPLVALSIRGGWLDGLDGIADFVRAHAEQRVDWLEVRDLRLDRPDLTPLLRVPAPEALAIVDIASVESVEPLGALGSLTSLSLAGCPVSDIGPVAGLERLAALDLRRSRVADLSPLHGLTRLERLRLSGAPVEPEQLADLRQALPRLQIEGP